MREGPAERRTRSPETVGSACFGFASSLLTECPAVSCRPECLQDQRRSGRLADAASGQWVEALRTRSPERRGLPARRPSPSACARPAGARALRRDCGSLHSPHCGSLLGARGRSRAAAVGEETPPAHPASAAKRSQGLAPVPATERRDHGAGSACGGPGTLISREGARNQGLAARGRLTIGGFRAFGWLPRQGEKEFGWLACQRPPHRKPG